VADVWGVDAGGTTADPAERIDPDPEPAGEGDDRADDPADVPDDGGDAEDAAVTDDEDPAGTATDDQGTDDAPGAGDERAALVEELRGIEYAKLKAAANHIGYDGNLNAATKDELVEFVADHADQVEAALADAGGE
jgi:hypothetical protein